MHVTLSHGPAEVSCETYIVGWTCQKHLFTCLLLADLRSVQRAPLGCPSRELPTAESLQGSRNCPARRYWRLSSEKWLSSILTFLLSLQDWSFSFSFFSTTCPCVRKELRSPGRVTPEFYASILNTVAVTPHLLKEWRMTSLAPSMRNSISKMFSILMLH